MRRKPEPLEPWMLEAIQLMVRQNLSLRQAALQLGQEITPQQADNISGRVRFQDSLATWNWSNHIEHGWGNFTPFIDGGVGNTVPDSKYFKKPFMTFGYNLSFEAGTQVDAGPLTFPCRPTT